MKQRGFTLIELLIVVAIIGILAAVGAAVIPGLLENAKIKAVQANHETITNHIKTELLRCDIGLELSAISHPNCKGNHKCNCSSCSDPSIALSYYSGTINCALADPDSDFKNPFKTSEIAFKGSSGIPPVKYVGRTYCGYESGSGTGGKNADTVLCHSRWGTGADDYYMTIIPNPYK